MVNDFVDDKSIIEVSVYVLNMQVNILQNNIINIVLKLNYIVFNIELIMQIVVEFWRLTIKK